MRGDPNMAIKFTARHMSGGTEHKHIASLKWIEDGKTETKESTREVLVDWVKDNGKGYVLDSSGDKAYVKVVESSPPYLQTQADGIWSDNLLALPTY
jgi:hypothetical protein